jgi:hypothetical protein
MANRRRNPVKEQFWRQVLTRRRGSGLSVRAFCEREGVSEASFYMWRRELAHRDRSGIKASAAFVPVRVVAETSTAIEIALPCGIAVRVRPGFDRQTLEQVVALFSGGAGC